MQGFISRISKACIPKKKDTDQKRVLPEAVISLAGLLILIFTIPIITAVKLVLEEDKHIFFKKEASASWTTDMVYWLDAQDLDGDGSHEGIAGETGQSSGQVSTWTNKTGGTDFTNTAGVSAGTTPDLKENQINFNAAIHFNESVTSDYLGAQVTDFPTTEITQFIVFKSTGTGDGIFSYATTGHDNEFTLFDQSSLVTIKEVRIANTGLDLNNGEANILSIDRVSSPGNTNVFVNSGAYVNNPYPLLSGAMDNAGTIILAQEQDAVGDGMAASQAMPGQIAEVITYNSVLSSVEQQSVNSYLAIKYGITLDQSSPTDYLAANGIILWDYSENSSYIHDIGGIGKDDDSDLNQPKSKSENTDAILTIGKNSGVTLTDGTHLLWGNDNGSTSTTEEVTVGARYGKMTRQWRIQEKNRTDAGSGIGTVSELGNVDVSFDLTGIDYFAKDVSLLIDDDGTFGTGSTVSGVLGSFNGDVVTFTGVDIDNGQFISIALFGIGPGGVAKDLVYWLDAQDLDGDNTPEGITGESGQSAGQVTTWTNKTGGTDFNTSAGLSSGTTPDLKDAQINFNASIEFNESGTTDYLGAQVTDFPSNTLTQFLIMKAAGVQDGIFSYATAGADNEFTFLSPNNLDVYVNNSKAQQPSNDLNDNVPHLLSVDRNSAVLNVFLDGLANSGNSYSANSGALTSSGTIILAQDQDTEGGGFQPSQAYEGLLAEIITYGSVLSTDDRKRVDSYLAIKYGITLDQTSGNDYTNSQEAVVWDYSENTTYTHDIAGIGRDDNSRLNQRQSKSINSDAIVMMGLDDDVTPDGLETSNLLNDGSFSSDRSFLIWSNDGKAIDASGDNSEKDDMLTHARLNREWRVQETGSVGTVTIQVDVSNIAGPSGIGTNDESQIQLMIDSDGDFSSGASLVYQSFVTPGDGLVKFRHDFTDGEFFTLASAEIGSLPVALISFGVEARDKGVTINWSTATELENAIFKVERSFNGFDFEEIANVSGAGTREHQSNYSLIDEAPQEGLNYYRLEDIDLAGNSNYSSIVSIEYSHEPKPSLAVYPNPIERGQDLNIQTPESGIRNNLYILDGEGRTLSIDRLNPVLGTTDMTLSTKSLDQGIYLIRYVTNNGQSQSLKLIIK